MAKDDDKAPEGNITYLEPEADPADALMAHLEMQPTTNPTQSFHVVDGKVVEGPTLPAREWYDYGLDTGPRIRPLRLIQGHDYDVEIEKQARRARKRSTWSR